MFIPVVLGQCRAGGANDVVARPPVASVHVASDLHSLASEGDLPKHNGKIYLALIDTGAEATAIDCAVADEIAAKPLYRGTVRAMNATTSAQGTDVQIIFPSCNLVFQERAVILDLHGPGNTWDLILGRSFLQNCRLLMDGPKRLYQLEWIGKPSDIDPTRR